MISNKIDEVLLERIIHDFEPFKCDNKNEYIIFFARCNETSISIFENKAKEHKVVFQGPQEKELALIYFPTMIFEQKVQNNAEAQEFLDVSSQIGSDEVGFGDFFGPIVVVASYCDSKTLEIISKYHIEDSKKMSDDVILKIVPQFIKKITYSCLTVEDNKLNELFAQGLNLNQIKSLLHNRALYNTSLKKPNISTFFIDQFTPEAKYYSYIKDEEHQIKGITFEIKGESKFPSVALSSVIARYTFLTYMEDLGKKYNVNIPLGASKKVDEFALEFIKKYGINELEKIIKKKFVNYENLLKLL